MGVTAQRPPRMANLWTPASSLPELYARGRASAQMISIALLERVCSWELLGCWRMVAGWSLAGILVASSVCASVMLSLGELLTFLYVSSPPARRPASASSASIKVITIIGLIILGLVIDLDGASDHERRGFRYWHHSGSFVQFNWIDGPRGRFLGSWKVLIGAAYALLGTEILGIAAAEICLPRTFRSPSRVSTNEPSLLTSTGNANSFAWVTAIRTARIKALPSIPPHDPPAPPTSTHPLAPCTVSLQRVKYPGSSPAPTSMELRGFPSFFRRRSRSLPIWMLMGVPGRHKVSPPYAVWWSLIWVILIILFNDWIFFLKGNWDHSSFITNYFLLPIFVILYFGYKWWYKMKIVPLEGMDFVTFANTKT
ncbi:hypothetical protein M422DRAFT_249833 [Sphaerobolus stellatus SS14]|uniref:Unplaced genomic scaffold SPHSTscaffold_31, whole genome shotgun sequence n=1 Tax=Sphaerobolus stellatus (strain SS14) TaxID=990650 RepID=A0A0C9VUP3_SPHS4|nr:hypothetical protein M422DRAFT_249833 [Sphaerobolus stellatus SS14]